MLKLLFLYFALLFVENDFSAQFLPLKVAPASSKIEGKYAYLFACLFTSDGYVYFYISRAQYEISSLEEIKTLPHVELESTSNTSSLNPYNVYHFIYIFATTSKIIKLAMGLSCRYLTKSPPPSRLTV